MENNLRYRNEDDRTYGATGMTVAMVVLDGDELISSVNIDAAPDAIMEYTEDYYFNGNPGLSAKSAWNTILKNFNFSMAATIGNVMCRRQMIDHASIDAATRQLLLDLVTEEGREVCDLDEDETRRLFDKNYVYLTRVFTHRGVQSVCRDFADTLKMRRRMSRLDIIDQLRALRML